MIAPDLIGFGDAPKPSCDLDLADLAEWTYQAARRAGLGQFAVVGHSMGAAVGILMAERRPDRVERVILSNGLVHGPTALFPFQHVLTRFPLRQVALALRSVRQVRRAISVDFSIIEKLNPAAARDLLRGTYRGLDSTLDAVLETDLEESLRRLRVPVGILWNENDLQLAPTQLEIQRRARPEAPVKLLSKGGHCPMIEYPEEYAAAVIGLLDTNR